MFRAALKKGVELKIRPLRSAARVHARPVEVPGHGGVALQQHGVDTTLAGMTDEIALVSPTMPSFAVPPIVATTSWAAPSNSA